MGWILPAMLGVSALSGFLGNKKGSRTQEQKSSSQFSNTTTPVENPAYAGVFDALNKNILGRLGAPSALPAGYQERGISGINQTYENIRKSIQNSLTSRGLGGSPVAGNALANLDLARGGDIVDFTTGLPEKERDYQTQDFAQALQLFGQRPIGQTQTGTSSSTGNIVFPGNAAAGALGDTGSMLGLLMALGKIGR